MAASHCCMEETLFRINRLSKKTHFNLIAPLIPATDYWLYCCKKCIVSCCRYHWALLCSVNCTHGVEAANDSCILLFFTDEIMQQEIRPLLAVDIIEQLHRQFALLSGESDSPIPLLFWRRIIFKKIATWASWNLLDLNVHAEMNIDECESNNGPLSESATALLLHYWVVWQNVCTLQ